MSQSLKTERFPLAKDAEGAKERRERLDYLAALAHLARELGPKMAFWRICRPKNGQNRAKNGEFRAWEAEIISHRGTESRREEWGFGPELCDSVTLCETDRGRRSGISSHKDTETRRMGSWTMDRNFEPLCLGVRRKNSSRKGRGGRKVALG